MGLRQNLKKQALGLSQKAFEKLMADEKRALKVAQAVGSVQRGKKALDARQEQLMRAFHFATKGDFKGLSKQLSSLKRRARELDEKLDAVATSRIKGH